MKIPPILRYIKDVIVAIYRFINSHPAILLSISIIIFFFSVKAFISWHTSKISNKDSLEVSVGDRHFGKGRGEVHAFYPEKSTNPIQGYIQASKVLLLNNSNTYEECQDCKERLYLFTYSDGLNLLDTVEFNIYKAKMGNTEFEFAKILKNEN